MDIKGVIKKTVDAWRVMEEVQKTKLNDEGKAEIAFHLFTLSISQCSDLQITNLIDRYRKEYDHGQKPTH